MKMELELVKFVEIQGFRSVVSCPLIVTISDVQTHLLKSCQLLLMKFRSESDKRLIKKFQKRVETSRLELQADSSLFKSVEHVKLSAQLQFKLLPGNVSNKFEECTYDLLLLAGKEDHSKPFILRALQEKFLILVKPVLWTRQSGFEICYQPTKPVLPELNGLAHAELRFENARIESHESPPKGFLSINLFVTRSPSEQGLGPLDELSRMMSTLGLGTSTPDQKLDQFVETNKRILEDGIASDTVIVAGNGKEFKCHKVFLFAQSPVFKTMFQAKMEESKTGRVETPDLSEKGVGALLKYLYYLDTREAAENLETAFELLYAARKYNVPRLEVEMMEVFSKLRIEEFPVHLALKLFLFLRTHATGQRLKMQAAQAMKLKFQELGKLDSYRELFMNDAEAAIELTEYLTLS